MNTRKAYCDGPFGQIHYRSAGEGKALILCHQSPTSSVQYSAVLPLLAEQGIHAIALDTPGFGMSDVPNKIPTVEDYAQSCIALIDHLGLESLCIAGHHTGSQTATEVALQIPDRIEKIILHGPMFFEEGELENFRSEMVPFEKGITPKADGSHMTELWNWRAMYAEGFKPEIMHKHIVPNLAAIPTAWYGHNACFAHETIERTKLLQQPTLVINNTGDAMYPFAVRAKELFPKFDCVELEGGTVDCIDEMPELWVEEVVSFLSRD